MVERQRAEVAGSEATAVVGDRKFDLFDSRHTAELVVALGIRAHIGQRIDIIKLFGSERRHRRVLNEDVFAVALDKRFSADSVGFFELLARGYGVIALVFFCAFKAWQIDNRFWNIVPGFDFIADTADILQGFYCIAVCEALCDLHSLKLAHSVDEDVCLCIEKDRRHYTVAPVIVVGKTAE